MLEITHKTLWDHLHDLKNLMLKIAGVWAVAAGLAMIFSDKLIEIVNKPLLDLNQTIHFLSPADSFFYVFKIYFLAGFLVTLPIILLLIWQYIQSGLQDNEKHFVQYYALGVGFLTLVATLYGYFSLIPSSLKFFIDLAPKGTTYIITGIEYINFLIAMLVSLILVFQTPVLVFGLVRSGIVSHTFFATRRRYFYFGSAVLLALFSPIFDIITFMIVLVPVWLFFEVALYLGNIGKSKVAQENVI